MKKLGETVAVDEDILEYESHSKQTEIGLGDIKSLTKNLGDTVEENEILAEGVFGLLFKKTIIIKSPTRGIISEFNSTSHIVKISSFAPKRTVKCPISGKIKEVEDDRIVIEFKGEEIKPIKIFGKNFISDMKKISGYNSEVDNNLITDEYAGKIIMGGHFSRSDLNKAMACGARAVIASIISEENFARFSATKILEMGNIKGNISLSIATLGEDNFEKLGVHKGKIYFNGESGIILIPK